MQLFNSDVNYRNRECHQNKLSVMQVWWREKKFKDGGFVNIVYT